MIVIIATTGQTTDFSQKPEHNDIFQVLKDYNCKLSISKPEKDPLKRNMRHICRQTKTENSTVHNFAKGNTKECFLRKRKILQMGSQT